MQQICYTPNYNLYFFTSVFQSIVAWTQHLPLVLTINQVLDEKKNAVIFFAK
jgi:hypothetical protein